jgi:hypothetical protein
MGAVSAIASAALIAVSVQAGPPRWVELARESASHLGKQLKADLTAAIQASGPAGGVEICQARAPGIAKSLSRDGLSVGRTALRLRNPDNAPDDWERAVLERFERRTRAGADPASLEHWTVEDADGRRVGRWMKAIPMQPQCATCHGTDVAASLAQTISDLYPEDRATGFEVGELRGAFTVEVELPLPETETSQGSAR